MKIFGVSIYCGHFSPDRKTSDVKPAFKIFAAILASIIFFFGFHSLTGQAATITWTNAVGGNWSNATNWSPNQVPGSLDTAVISAGGTYSVTLDVNATIAGLIVGGSSGAQTFSINANTLTLNGLATINTNGLFNLGGGTILGGVVLTTNGTSLVVRSGTLNGVTVDGILDVGNSDNEAGLAVTNGLTLNGTLLMGNPTNSSWGGLEFLGTQTLGGNGVVVFGNQSSYYNALFLANGGTSLTLGPGITVHGQNGTLGYGSWWGGAQNISITNQGTISCDVSGGTIVVNAQPLVNDGTLAMSNGGSLNLNYLASVVGLFPSGSGTLTLNGNWVNNEVLSVSGSTLTLSGSWTNAGVISVTNSTVNLEGGFTLADLGVLNRSGGTVNLEGAFTNTGTTLTLSGATNSWVLTGGGSILGGTVVTTNGASLIAGAYSGGSLNGVTVDGTLDVGNSGSEVSLLVTNGLTLNGTLLMGNPTNSSWGGLEFLGTQTLGGNGLVVFGNQNPYYNALFLANGATSLTFGPQITVHGQNGTLGYGSWWGGAQNISITNQGTISCDVNGGAIAINAQPLVNNGTLAMSNGGSLNLNYLANVVGLSLSGGGTLTLNGSWVNDEVLSVSGSTLTLSGSWTNAGVISVTNSTVNLEGGFTLADLGVLNRSGGTVNLEGAFTNTGTTLTLSGATNSWVLTGGGSILGGTVVTTNGASLIAGAYSGGSLNGVTVDGTLDVGNSGSEVSLLVTNGLTLNGTLLMGNPTNSSWGGLEFLGTQTLGGNGAVVFGNQSSYYNALFLANGGTSLTLGPGITVHGQNGTVGYGSWWGGAQNISIANQGTISCDVSGGTIVINAQPFSNVGTLEAPIGKASLSGTYNLSGGTIDIGINGSSSFGQINFAGNVSLGGTFGITLNNGYQPVQGSSFAVLNYGTENAPFSSYNLPNSSLPWQVSYGSSSFFVTAVQQLVPIVNIISPTNNTTYQEPVNVTINATATSMLGAITKVDFFEGSNELGEVLNSPYSVTWSNVPPGAFPLTATAADTTGAVGASSGREIIVLPNVAGTNYTWVGGISSDWFTAGNWSPAGVPGISDEANINNSTVSLSTGAAIGFLNLTSGTINGSGQLMVGNTFYWTGGSLYCPLMIQSNATLILSGSSTLNLYAVLTNAGTVDWTGTGNLQVYNYAPYGYTGGIVNLAGGVFNAENDQSIINWQGTEYFNNSGLFRKWPTTGTTTIDVAFNNSGTVNVQSGTIDFNGNGNVGGTYTAAANTGLGFGGNNAGTVAIGTVANVSVYGGAVSLSGTVQNLSVSSGTLTFSGLVQNLGVSGGTFDGVGSSISNLTWNGGTLGGNETVTGSGSWTSGTIASGGTLTISTNAVLNISGSSTLNLYGVLTNAGTVDWTGTGNLQVYNYAPYGYTGGIVNLAGGVFNAENDQSIINWQGTEYFNNSGLFRKSPTSGTTTIDVGFNNSGIVNVQSGTIDFNGNESVGGTYTAAANTGLGFGGNNTGTVAIGTVANLSVYGGAVSLSGTVQNLSVSSGTLTFSGPVQNLGVSGGTFDGINSSISNLTWNGGNLGGNETVTGSGSWTSGTIASGGALTISTNVVFNISGSSTLDLYGVLTNAGTVDWTGTGNLQVYNYAPYGYTGGIVNLAGGVFNAENDQAINDWQGSESFNNAGLFRKSPSIGTTVLNLVFSNTGTLEVDSGTVSFNDGGTSGGTMSLGAAGTLLFPGSYTINAGGQVIGGGTVKQTGGTLTMNGNMGIGSLSLANGTFVQFGSLTVTNPSVSLVSENLSGNVVANANWNWSGADNSVPVAP